MLTAKADILARDRMGGAGAPSAYFRHLYSVQVMFDHENPLGPEGLDLLSVPAPDGSPAMHLAVRNGKNSVVDWIAVNSMSGATYIQFIMNKFMY